MGLIEEDTVFAAEPLAGGVSSDIWKITLADRIVCVKQALSRLKVKQVWEVPTERSQYEIQWLKTAREIVPDTIPLVVGEDAETGSLAMEYLPPEHYSVWKSDLRDGIMSVSVAKVLGDRLATIHGNTAHRDDIAEQFKTDELFFELRPSPFFLTAAEKHPLLAPNLTALTDKLMSTKIALVHGDISPKNILVGPNGPVIIDAECAWYGDPAFDLAFCLNHLLLKCLWHPEYTAGYIASYGAMADTYLGLVNWEEADQTEQRVAALLPALMLARVDGKSPVEYLTMDKQHNLIRDFTGPLIMLPVSKISDISNRWQKALYAAK